MNNVSVENVKLEQALKVDFDNIKYTKIKKISNEPYVGKVHDLKIDDKTIANYSDADIVYLNGGGRRKGSVAIYAEPHSADIEDFLDLRKNNGKEENRCRDLFTAIWMPDLFMQRVEADQNWTLFSSDEAPGLQDVYDEVVGEAGSFTKLYEKYETEKRGRKTMKARELFTKIIDSQIETGTPYIVFKDSVNRKSNQKNIGVIKCSNLCAEVVEFTSPEEHATCNLASMPLPKYLAWDAANKKYFYDHKALFDAVVQVVKNLNRVIDVNYYPTIETKRSNDRHRPVAIGAQGLADIFAMCEFPFESTEARQLNKEIFETMYFAALSGSVMEAKMHGPYSTFEGSPASLGILQYHMAGLTEADLTTRWDWKTLISEIKTSGLRNSLLLSVMPTASSAQILSNNECCEPFTSNIYMRKTLSGEFPMVNKHLVRTLEKNGLWNETVINKIILNDGSVQGIAEIPERIQQIFKTVWEIKQRSTIDLAADRQAFVCQSQSMNLFIANCNAAKVSSALFYGWKSGLKTGMYYLRTKSVSAANKALGISVDAEIAMPTPSFKMEAAVDDVSCSIDNPEDCVACGS